MSKPKSDSILQRAQVALAQQNPAQAANLCRQALLREPANADARYLLGLAHALQGNAQEAIGNWQQVLRIRPKDFATTLNLGIALSEQGKHSEAVARLQAALELDDTQAEAHYSLGNSLLAVGEIDAAITSFRAALSRRPNLAQARNNLGVAYRRVGRIEEAREEFAAAVSADPGLAEAHSNLGSAIRACGQPETAIPHLIRALNLDQHCIDAAMTLSQTLEELGRPAESLTVLATAAGANPNSPELLHALGIAQHRAGQLEAALSSYDRTLAVRPDAFETWRDRGLALERLQHLTAALDSHRKALELAPRDVGALVGALSCCVRICEWSQVAHYLQQIRRAPEGLQTIHPFLALSVIEDPAEQLRISSARTQGMGQQASSARVLAKQHARVRVAYISSDLRDHAVGHLLTGILENHDRARFEVHAVSLQPETVVSDTGARLKGAAEHFHDVFRLGDSEVVQHLRRLEIDIAVDLNGHTVGGRPGLFAQRVSAVQVNYLGYAGTFGAPCMDYVLADGVVIPAGDEGYYSEQVVRLPHCYLPNDDRRAIGAVPTREQAGLPPRGMVFCAFTNAYKLNPPMFDIWMRLLQALPESVLWLRGMAEEARGNLQREAQRRGVSGDRLVYAPHVASMADHLGRQSLADLYLDTLPYNAHSTSCDALWSGVPVLTCMGRSFAGRVAASALTAVGLPELITHSLEEYEHKALQLAQQPQQLKELRERLARHRTTHALFDTPRFTRHLESAFLSMHQRALDGEAPRSFDVLDPGT